MPMPILKQAVTPANLLRFLTTNAMSAAEAAIDIPPDGGEPASTSRIHSSFFGTSGAAFLYLDGLNRHAMTMWLG